MKSKSGQGTLEFIFSGALLLLFYYWAWVRPLVKTNLEECVDISPDGYAQSCVHSRGASWWGARREFWLVQGNPTMKTCTEFPFVFLESSQDLKTCTAEQKWKELPCGKWVKDSAWRCQQCYLGKDDIVFAVSNDCRSYQVIRYGGYFNEDMIKLTRPLIGAQDLKLEAN